MVSIIKIYGKQLSINADGKEILRFVLLNPSYVDSHCQTLLSLRNYTILIKHGYVCQAFVKFY